MTTLLADLEPMLLVEQRHLVAETIGAVEPATADERNEGLRRLLTAVIESLPDDSVGDSARRSIAEHLRLRTAANPALHKDPQRPWAPESAHVPTDKATP